MGIRVCDGKRKRQATVVTPTLTDPRLDEFFDLYVTQGQGPQWNFGSGLYTNHMQDSDWVSRTSLFKAYQQVEPDAAFCTTPAHLFEACRQWMQRRFASEWNGSCKYHIQGVDGFKNKSHASFYKDGKLDKDSY